MHRFDRVLVCVFLGVFLGMTGTSPWAVAQIGGIKPPAGYGPSHTINGLVVNSVTSQPIARALVQLNGARAMLTDHEGRFEFTDVSEEAVATFASKPGYTPMENAVFAMGEPITLRLLPEAILSGIISDQNGQPIQDLQLQLKMLQVRSGLLRWDQVQATTTNAEGEYRFADLQAGKYRVDTGFHLDGLPDAESSIAYVPVVYPPVTGDHGSDALTLSAGEHAQADINPPVEKLYRVTGLIHGMVGQGAGFEITTQDGQTVSPALHVFPSGAFWCRLPSGNYHFKVNGFQGQQQLTGSRDVHVGQAALEGVLIDWAPQPSIRVEVEYQSVATSTQQDQTNGPPYLNLSLEQSDAAGAFRVFNAEPVPPSNGTEPARAMVIKNVEPGRYEVRVQMNGPWYLASATCGNLDLLREPLVIAPEAGVCSIRAVLRNDAASLKWSVAPGDAGKESDAGKPGHGAQVIAIPLNNLTQSVEAASSYANLFGSAPNGLFQQIAPGRYLVMMVSHPEELPYREAGAMERYLALGQEVTLTRNGQAEIQLHSVVGEP
jgi:Carboxypeptidase regulatory-like domain